MTEAQSIRMLEAAELAAQSLRTIGQLQYVQTELLTKIHGLLVRNSEPARSEIDQLIDINKATASGRQP